MKTAEKRMKELQKLIEYGRNYLTYEPVLDEYRQIRWTEINKYGFEEIKI